MADRIAGLVLLAIAVAAGILTLGVDPGFGLAGPSPRSLPWALSAILAACGLWLLARPASPPVQSQVEPEPNLPTSPPPSSSRIRVLAMIVMTLALVFAFPLVDFRLLAWAFMLGAMLVIGARNWRLLVALPPCLALFLDTLFRQGFGVVLPSWI